MPVSKDQRSLRQIMSQAGKGAKADQAEVNAAVSRFTVFFIPVIVFLVSLNLAVALPLYWLVSSTMAYFQQARVLEADVTEAEAIADRPTSKAAAKPAKTTKAIKPAPAGRVTETKSGLKVTRRTISATQNQKNARKSKRRKR
jgi:membrane protein insertase Oxa1/YidC/SpoIIIJ